MIKQAALGLMIAGSVIGCAQENVLEIEGKLRMTGSGHKDTYLVIEDPQSHTSYRIKNAKTFGLIRKQKQTVKLKARLIDKAKGPGRPAVVEVVEVD